MHLSVPCIYKSHEVHDRIELPIFVFAWQQPSTGKQSRIFSWSTGSAVGATELMPNSHWPICFAPQYEKCTDSYVDCQVQKPLILRSLGVLDFWIWRTIQRRFNAPLSASLLLELFLRTMNYSSVPPQPCWCCLQGRPLDRGWFGAKCRTGRAHRRAVMNAASSEDRWTIEDGYKFVFFLHCFASRYLTHY